MLAIARRLLGVGVRTACERTADYVTLAMALSAREEVRTVCVAADPESGVSVSWVFMSPSLSGWRF
jgi:hypothetical protein